MLRMCPGALLLLIGSAAALTEWQTQTVDLCQQPLLLTCTPNTQLVIRRATYQPDQDQPPSDTMRLRMRRSLLSVVEDCDDKSYCEPNLDESLLEQTCGTPEVSVIVDVEYACAAGRHLQPVCGGEKEFKSRDQGFVVNHLYPRHSTGQRCTLIFMVGKEKLVTVRPMTLTLPSGWSARFCNLTLCEQLSVDIEELTLTGNSHIKMAPVRKAQEPNEQFMFAFEYKVDEVYRDVKQLPEDPQFDPADVGVIKMEKRTQTAAIAAGVGVPTALVALLAAVYVYQSRHSDEKLAEEESKSSQTSDMAVQPIRGIRIAWGEGHKSLSRSRDSSI